MSPISHRCWLMGAMFLILSLRNPIALGGAGFPTEKLPPFITRLTERGERADFSLDGRRILYLTQTGGEVEEIDLATRTVRRISNFPRPSEVGFYRALYLANGDYLLTGGPGRRETYFYILDKALKKPPSLIKEMIWEGPAVSRKKLRIAWTPNHEEIWMADIDYSNGTPLFIHKKRLLDNRHIEINGVRYEDWLEPQNFRPPDEEELTFSLYGRGDLFTAEVGGFHLKTGKIVNYSQAPGQYDEPEGICPNGRYTLVECDRHNPKGTGYIDLYLLKLDGSGQSERITHFADVPGYKASNPVVSDDGRWIAFQEGRNGDDAGVGHGLYLLDTVKAGIANTISK
jgi:hypothetical protein